MVFESLLVSVLNRAIGSYVENLDQNQLSVGIWGGDVELKDLILKQSALQLLNLPVQTVYGKIGKLALKIPWKNLYGSTFVVNVTDIYLVAVPNLEIKYDRAREEQNAYDYKQDQINKIERAKKLETGKDNTKADDTFAEKLLAQIVKNLQLNIKNIHIRYEDTITNSGFPFAIGLTLHQLNVVSTDENWTPTVLQDFVYKSYKVVDLESLGMYWNCNTKIYSKMSQSDIVKHLYDGIATKQFVPKGYTYLLGPINSSARLRMNQKPERDHFTIPEYHLNFDMEKIFIGFSKCQYCDILKLGESMNTMMRGMPYHRFRPNVTTYRGHYREWWQFAINSILELHIRRVNRNWDWNHMKNHSIMCKDYGNLYKKKLLNTAKPNELQEFENCEKNLDITSIVIVRQRIEMEVERVQKKEQAQTGWFSWMWSGSETKSDSSTSDLMEQFDKAMTPQEKARLYKAIDYQEHELPPEYPETYVNISCIFVLRRLELELRDGNCNADPTVANGQRILFTELTSVKCRLDKRPVNDALKACIKIENFTTFGYEQGNFIPEIIQIAQLSEDSEVSLLEVNYETNPLDGHFDQRLHVLGQPLIITYDAQTIIKLLNIFKVPEEAHLEKLSAAAGSGLSNVKEMTAAGLQYSIEHQNRLDLKFMLRAPLIIIPEDGKYCKNGEKKNLLLINLGILKVNSIDSRASHNLTIRELFEEGMGQQEILQEMIEHSYEQFQIELDKVQIVMAHKSENWQEVIDKGDPSDMHLLYPLSFKVLLSKCLVHDDPKLPLSKATGELKSICFNIIDSRLFMLAHLATSIPLPGNEEEKPQRLTRSSISKFGSQASLNLLNKYKEITDTPKPVILPTSTSTAPVVQFTKLDVNFTIHELSAVMSHQQNDLKQEKQLVAKVVINSIEGDLIQQMYGTRVSMKLTQISMEQLRDNKKIHIIKTNSENDVLFKIEYTNISTKSPELHSVYKSCEQKVILDFGSINILLHREGILSLLTYSNELQRQLDEIVTQNKEKSIDSGQVRPQSLPQVAEELISYNAIGPSTVSTRVGQRKKRGPGLTIETIKFRLIAKLSELSIVFATDLGNIATFAIRGINTDILMKTPYTQISGNLMEIAIIDMNPETIHNLILSGTEGEALTTQIVINNLNPEDENEKADMVIEMKLGGLRIVFLNWFVNNMLNFVNQFQTAQQAVIEVSQAAAQTAKENMKDVYEKATKISLDIKLKAPDIIVPVNSKSYEAIILDLGHISLSNCFLMIDVRSSTTKHSPVIDELKITLANLKLARIKLNKEHQIEKECPLLQPLSMTLTIKRNLSTSWYRLLPNVDVSGKIQTINLLLSEKDYQMLMSIMEENLSEGQLEQFTPASSSVPPKAKEDKLSDEETTKERQTLVIFQSHQTIAEETLLEDEECQRPATDFLPPVYAIFKFTFSMEQLIVSLYSGGAKTLSDKAPFHDPKSQLARFSLEGLSLKGRILSNDSLITSILLVNCLLDDMRYGREDKLNRLIERTNLESSEQQQHAPRSMIDVTFQKKGNDIFADVRVYSFKVILSVDYLMKVAAFFNTPSKNTKVAQPVQTTQKSSKNLVASKSHLIDSEPKSNNLQMTLNLKIEKPDIVLVEQMDNINTNAMILNCEIVVKIRTSGPHQVINGCIRDLQLYVCNYNPEKRVQTRSDILHPVTISLAGSTPQNKGLHLELLLTDFHVRVSPATIQLVARVIATMSSSGEVTEVESSTDIVNHSDLWDKKCLNDNDYWFLKPEVSWEALEEIPSDISLEAKDHTHDKLKLQELCIISMPSIVVTVETGVGTKTIPMILLETSVKGAVRNWSSQLGLEASLSVQMVYYNSRLALWEPFIEPVEVIRDNKLRGFVPWELKVDISMTEAEDVMSQPTTSATDDVNSPTASVTSNATYTSTKSIDVTSENTLEITITKTCLEVLNSLGSAFAEAVKPAEIQQVISIQSPYELVNELGVPVTLLLDKSNFEMASNDGSDSEVAQALVNSGATAYLILKNQKDTTVSCTKLAMNANKIQCNFIHVKVNDFELNLPVSRADKRYFPLGYRNKKDNCGIVSEVKIDGGVTKIILRSILQIHNHFNIPIEVYYMTEKGNELELISTIDSNKILNIPLKSVYTSTAEIFFAVNEYSVSTIPFVWKELQSNVVVNKILQCSPKNRQEGQKKCFIIKVIGEMEQIYYENTTRYTMASTIYNINLRPAMIFVNSLPIPVICCLEHIMVDVEVKQGGSIHLPNVEPGRTALVIRLQEYLEKEWSCRQELKADFDTEFSVWTFNSYDGAVNMSICLGMNTQNKNGSILMTLYCPFWMLNKTGMMLGYRKSKKFSKNEGSASPAKSGDDNMNVLHHPANFKGPILFSFNSKNFFGKKKASVRVDQGEWSNKFSLDVAGSSGVIICKANDKKYQIGVHNQFTYNGLTKQVTFTPYYIIINNAPFGIECQESDRPADSWITIQSQSCEALWPNSDKEDKLLKLRVVNTKEISKPFLYTESHTTLLKLQNKFGGINVDIQLTEGAVYINFTAYEVGMAPALIVNHTKRNIIFWEKESIQKREIESKKLALYTWQNPSGPRLLIWERDEKNKKEIENDLRKDGAGEILYPGTSSEPNKIYWVSFLDGMQRILLFTEEKIIAENAEASNIFEIIEQEVTLHIPGVGISVVNNYKREEIMYVGIASSGVIWEQAKLSGTKRFKHFPTKESNMIEQAYQQFLLDNHVTLDDSSFGSDVALKSPSIVLDGKYEIDFILMMMARPNKRKIRRVFQTGFWLQMKTSPSQMQLHIKINRIQIDHQVYDCIFPVILAPVPPPKSVAADSGIKPFIEVSIVQLLMKNCQIQQYKYFKVLVQEFHIKIDMGFVSGLFSLMENEEHVITDESKLFLKDLQLVDEPLFSHASIQSRQEKKNFYDLLHFSPLKIHISFSMSTGGSGATSSTGTALPHFVNVLLQGIGVTLTDLQDVVFKLAYFERSHTFLTQKQLVSEATSHYVGQSVKQLYVLVLGLDVLGNPYGLVLGITKGVEDLFYEPFQGAIQGPGEFAEGLVLGIRSLFGHTVGGAAGAVSKIAGAMGKGLAALTFDDEYQRKRREQMNKKPATVQEGFARSGKGLVMGVVDGVTGVFTQPVTGARDDGIEGFFKGLGKGAMGLVARPAAGVIDFASESLGAVKRATDMGEDATRLRAPRFLQADGHVRPYNSLEAQGHKLLSELNKGKYAKTDMYVHHQSIVGNKETILLTDQRIAYVTHNDLFGGYQVEWSYTWSELKHPAKVVTKGVSLTIGEAKRKTLFGSSENVKIILIADPAAREELCFKIESLRTGSTE